jgi:hypothetical protein
MIIIDSTDKKYLGLELNSDQIFKGNSITFPDGFVFEIMGIIEEDNLIEIFTPNYIIKLEE